MPQDPIKIDHRWRIGMKVTPRDKTHDRHGQQGTITGVWSGGYAGVRDRDCVLIIDMGTEVAPGWRIWVPASQWMEIETND